MERVVGDNGAIASSKNACGMAFRCLMAKGALGSFQGSFEVLRTFCKYRAPCFS